MESGKTRENVQKVPVGPVYENAELVGFWRKGVYTPVDSASFVIDPVTTEAHLVDASGPISIDDWRSKRKTKHVEFLLQFDPAYVRILQLALESEPRIEGVGFEQVDDMETKYGSPLCSYIHILRINSNLKVHMDFHGHFVGPLSREDYFHIMRYTQLYEVIKHRDEPNRLFKLIALAHELGHAADFFRNYFDCSGVSYSEAQWRFAETRSEDLKTYLRDINNGVPKNESYLAMPQEKTANAFAIPLVKQVVEELGL